MRQEFDASLTFGRNIEVGRHMQVCDDLALPQRVMGHIAVRIIPSLQRVRIVSRADAATA
jgi:hypothetical protein